MMGDLASAVEELETDKGVHSVLIYGAQGRGFCSGGDLNDVMAYLIKPGVGAQMCRFMTGVMTRLSELPMVVIAAIDGAALGGGAEMVTACDRVITASDARIGFVHASLGVSPGWGGGSRLVGRVGRPVAMDLLTTGRIISGDTAHNVGLADHVVPPNQIIKEARQYQTVLSSLPVESVRAAAQIVKGNCERELFTELWGSAAHRESLFKKRGQ